MRSATAAVDAARMANKPRQPNPWTSSLGRTRGGQCTQGPQHDVPAVGEGDALGREPQDDGLEAGHQADRHTETDQGAPEHQGPDAVGKGEQEGPGSGDQEQRAVDEARPVAVDEHAAGERAPPRTSGNTPM